MPAIRSLHWPSSSICLLLEQAPSECSFLVSSPYLRHNRRMSCTCPRPCHTPDLCQPDSTGRGRLLRRGQAVLLWFQTTSQPLEGEIDHRRRVERQQLRDDQPADNREAERLADLGAGPKPSISGTPPRSADMVVIMIGRKRIRHASRIASSGARPRSRSAAKREVDHHDPVLLHDADQQHQTDQADDIEAKAEPSNSTGARPARRGKGRQDRQRMHDAFVQDAKDDVDRDERRRDEVAARWRANLECLRGALERSCQMGGGPISACAA